MRRLVHCAAAALLAVAWLVLPVPRAEAATNQITRMVVNAQIDLKGRMTVVQTLDMEFTGTNDHGPYLFFKTRHETGGSLWRVLEYRLVSVTSPTGAPAQAQTSEGPDGTYQIRVGDPQQTVSGLHTYVVSYTVDGVVNPRVASSGMDEVFWNAIGTGFQGPVSDITVTITSSATVSQTQCWAGADFNLPCDEHSHTGGGARFAQRRLGPGEGLAVVAGWPAGTFSSTPILRPRTETPRPERQEQKPKQNPLWAPLVSPASAFGRTPWGPGVAGGLSLIVVVLRVVLERRRRDQMYAGVTPGLTPAPGTTPTVTLVDEVPVAVRFTPPDDLTPGMVGTLINESADTPDVTATIIDLAVRGYLRLEARPEVGTDAFLLVRLQDSVDGLRSYEQRLMQDLFGDAQKISSGTLARRRPDQMLATCRLRLDQAVTEAGLFRSSPQAARASARTRGVMLLVWALPAGLALAMLGVAELAVPLAVAGLVTLGYARQAPVRTADGTAAYVQALGFRLYLETAEADQLGWEESEDIFSRYLPYAIVFGCAERWVAIFNALAKQGVRLPKPTWYVGERDHNAWDYQTSLDISRSFERVVENPQGSWGSRDGSSRDSSSSSWSSGSSSSHGSSGGSGFSSGGYSGGGGGGSWGHARRRVAPGHRRTRARGPGAGPGGSDPAAPAGSGEVSQLFSPVTRHAGSGAGLSVLVDGYQARSQLQDEAQLAYQPSWPLTEM
ncbi:MAG: DUF2207 domain-containing protein [Actinomycetia bacterium]|nr:DUF2207 domain-containing protein [Actinomycetes bacterium]